MAAIVAAAIWGTYTLASGPSVSIDENEPVAIAIVMDNSPTSAWRDGEDDRIRRMQELAVWRISQIPRSSRIAVLDRSAAPPAYSLDASGAISKIERVEPRQVVQSLAARIDAAARLLRTNDIENRQILVITDLATSTWDESMAEAGLVDSLGAESPIGLAVFDLGPMTGTNRSLSIPKLADATPPLGTPIPISTILTRSRTDQSDDDASATSVIVELEMYESDPSTPVVRDGKVVYPNVRSVDRTSVRLADGGSSELLMTIPSLPLGTHHGRVRLTGDDALAIDDVRHFSLSVLPPSTVLIVSDDERESYIFSQVLAPTSNTADDASSEFRTERIGSTDLGVARLADYDAVVLLDPSPAVLGDRSIVDYVDGGGGVLVALGPAAGDESVESPFAPRLVRRWRSPASGTFLQTIDTSHPIVAAVASDTPWNDFRINQYWQIEPGTGDSVLMQYAGTDHAAIVAAGRVLTLTTPIPARVDATRKWNDLFGTDPWPAWLLIRQSVEFLTGRGDNQVMTLVGQPHIIELPVAESPQVASGAAESANQTRLQLFPPNGESPVPLEVSASATQVAVGEVRSAGTYWLRGGGFSRAGGEASRGGSLGFSANLGSAAITTDRADKGLLDSIFGPDGYTLATMREEIELSDNQSATRVSLHSPAMLLALIIFLLEQVLGNRFYRRAA
ncbi:hypothetical protein [Rubripirellula tenax]|uniref:hypothetical protein n=1 Tax=Rubripirellula tenax TaxID=2528015 RepID=UPI001648EA61|nr:hypothetical protein [Rubripirellula tenax]